MSRFSAAPIVAVLNRDGCIMRADPPLLALQMEAGGQAGGAFALPALAALVRLALRLGTPLSRSVELACVDADISVWVELRPEGDQLHVALHDWQERRPRLPRSRAGALQLPEPRPVLVAWNWEVDDQMRFAAVEANAERIGHAIPEDGETFTAFFALDDSPSGEKRGMPMIEALVRHMNFEGQFAHLRRDDTVRYLLSGTALFDRDGRFAGYRGHAVKEVQSGLGDMPQETKQVAPIEVGAGGNPVAEKTDAPEEMFGPALSRRLDSALRQPISRIIANAATISDRMKGPLRQDYASYAGDIASAGRHLLALVDDLADLQALEGAGFSPILEEVDLSETARRAAGLLNIRADARRIMIKGPTADEQLFARAEYRRVLQILVNLVGNAVRHSPENSTIWIRLDEVDGRARVIVADQGGGIDPTDHDRIFERFERLGNNDGAGSGLGLYISRRFARAMGGDVTIESALGSGSRFMLELPVWSAEKAASQGV